MNDYYCTRVSIAPWSDIASDLLGAWLADIGYESFVAEDECLAAYIPAESYDSGRLDNALRTFPMPGVALQASSELVEGRDWNAEWEKNYFKPLTVDDKVVVHSSFHADVPQLPIDIVIDPRMAFGTGHHSTTRLMIRAMLGMNLNDATVIDMGTGTGILAILALMLGAAKAYGIEIDPGAWENALDNAALNNVAPELICGDAMALEPLPQADLFLANINRNIILADICLYAPHVKKGGRLVVSGLYSEDVPLVKAAAEAEGFSFIEAASDDNWTRVSFIKQA